jgi:cysteine synthase
MKAIGNTPLIKLEHLPGPGCAEIYVKYEGANPTGSMKDRMELSMVEGAESRGDIAPGGRVIDYTGGSTGSSLAMVCATKGYQAHFVSSDCFADEKLQTMKAFGATLEIFPSEDRKITAGLIDSMVARARELSTEPNTFWTDQFNNVDNRNAYHKMAHEVIDVSEKTSMSSSWASEPAGVSQETRKYLKTKFRTFAASLSSRFTFARFPVAISRTHTD